jgi:SMI1-KNR4 cell-wall
MKDIRINNERTKLNNININLIENKLDIKLPEDYKHFLLTHNGGYPEKSSYTFIEVKNSSNVDRFLAFYDIKIDFSAKIYDDLLKECLRYEDRIPKECIPIAPDSGGNYLCLCVKGSEYGKVYFWDHEEEADEGEKPTFLNMYLIANNFTDFINSLYSVDIKGKMNSEGILKTEKYIYTHDKYSLPFSTHAKKYGSLVTEFFAKAPSQVEDYVIEEYESNKDIVLYFDIKHENKRYKRIINADREIDDIIEEIN